MECLKDMGLQKRHSQFSDTKYKWRTIFACMIILFMSICYCNGQDYGTDPYLVNRTVGLTELPGGVITGGRTVWKPDSSPYLLRDDLVIERDAELIVEPGVEVRFAPMIGITVRGRLLAVVSSLLCCWSITQSYMDTNNM